MAAIPRPARRRRASDRHPLSAPRRTRPTARPDLVQLLTPEGERVEHPDYAPEHLTADDAARLLPRPGPGPPAGRRGHRAAAPGRAGHLGQPARPGGRPGRLRPGARAAGQRLPDLPRARRRLVPRASTRSCCSACSAASTRAAGTRRVQLQPVHDRDRRADAARHRLRDGHAARRRVGTGEPDGEGGDRLLRRRRHRPGRRQRGVRLRQRLQRPGRVLLPEQPVRDLRAARAADPDPALPARRRLRLPRRPGRRQRRAGLLRGDTGRAGPRPQRPGADADRGLHLPDGRAHHLRRPDPLPDRGRGRGVEGQGPDRPAEGLPGTQRRSPTRTFFDGDRGRGRRAGRARSARGLPGDARPARR